MPHASISLYHRLAPALLLAAFRGTAPNALAQQPSFTLMGQDNHLVLGLSADGRSAAGYLSYVGNVTHSFLWTADGGRIDFGSNLSNLRNRCLGISGDGLAAVGTTAYGSTSRAFRWSQATGYQELPTFPGYNHSAAMGVSQDGSVIAGTAVLDNNGTNRQAFRWTQSGGMQGLGEGTNARTISRDGNVIIGDFGGLATNSFRWTQADGVEVLPALNELDPSRAYGINHDGSIIVGTSGSNTLPTMWIHGTPTELLPDNASSHFSYPVAVNDSGTVVAGSGRVGLNTYCAMVWTPSTGSISLADYLAANGVTIPFPLVLEHCTAVSADGTAFAGYTTSNAGAGGVQGFVATIPTPCPADLDNDGSLETGGTRDRAVTIDDLLYLLTAFESGNLAADLDNGSGNGTRDNAVTIDDLLYFLSHFEAGC
jgi:uncharacterized membrane protein